MGYFTGVTNACFKQGKDGKTLFFPWGVFGKGRVLPDEERAVQLRGFLARLYKTWFACVLLSLIIGSRWPLAVIIALSIGVVVVNAWLLLGMKRLLAGCPPSDERLRVRDAYGNSAAGFGKPTLWVLFVCCVVGLVAGMWLAITAQQHGHHFYTGLFSIVACAVSLAATVYTLRLRRAA